MSDKRGHKPGSFHRTLNPDRLSLLICVEYVWPFRGDARKHPVELGFRRSVPEHQNLPGIDSLLRQQIVKIHLPPLVKMIAGRPTGISALLVCHSISRSNPPGSPPGCVVAMSYFCRAMSANGDLGSVAPAAPLPGDRGHDPDQRRQAEQQRHQAYARQPQPSELVPGSSTATSGSAGK